MSVDKELRISALGASVSAPGNYALVLEEPLSHAQVVITIGSYEAQSIAVYLERMKIHRPLTYDLFKETILALGGTLKEVKLHRFDDGVFHALLLVLRDDKKLVELDARASDALALAVRFGCPITIPETVLDEVIIAESEKRLSLIKGSLANYTLVELENLLESLLKKEDYESASRIRDLITKRKR